MGPSGVKTRFVPLRALRRNSRSAALAPRDDEPRTVSTPYQWNTRAMYSPSFEREVMTMIGRRKRECSISSRCACQKARMYCGTAVRFSGRTCSTRRVAWRARMNSAAMTEMSFTMRRAVYRAAV